MAAVRRLEASAPGPSSLGRQVPVADSLCAATFAAGPRPPGRPGRRRPERCSTVGALSIYRSGDRPAADADDVATMREVAAWVGLALDNSWLYEQQSRLAEGLRRSLLTAPPEPDHAEIVVRYRPAMRAAEVGCVGRTRGTPRRCSSTTTAPSRSWPPRAPS